MAEANPPHTNKDPPSTESGSVEEISQSRVNRVSLSTGSDAMDSTQSRVNRISLSTGSDAMDATQSRVKRISLSTGSDAMDATLSRVNRMSLSTGSDAIPDVKRHTLSSGSDVIFELVCIPCDNSGDLNEAVGYCTKCDEHMCQTCMQSHKQTHSTKHHTLLDKAAMPRVQSTSSDKYTDTERCKVHTDKMVKYYCPSHNATACGVCLISTHHNKCQDTIYIPDEAKTIPNSKEFGEFQALINDQTKKSDNLSKSLDANMDLSADYLSDALRDIETFQQEVNDELDKCKATIVEKMEEISARDKAAMSSAADKNNHVQTELKKMSADIKALLAKKQNCQAFIEMKNADSKLADFQQQLEEVMGLEKTVFWFNQSKDLQRLIHGKDWLGDLVIKNPAEIRATHVADLKVKTKDNKETCCISGCTVLSPTRLAAVDCWNETVKLIDTERQRLISEYKPEARPYDVTTVNAGIAVTLPDAGKIIFMKADDKLRLDKEIHVDHHCGFIAYSDDQLVVGCSDPSAVRVLSMTGQLLQTFSTSSTGEPLFSCNFPSVTVSPVTGDIYACDSDAQCVLQLHRDGGVTAAYRDDDMENPSYAAIDELGVIYVTGYSSNNVHVLTPGCNKVKIILTERDGIKSPRSISYCRNTRRLYIGLRGSDNLKVYQLS